MNKNDLNLFPTDMESLPTLQSLHQALVSENAVEAEDELLSVITHLIVCAIGTLFKFQSKIKNAFYIFS